MDKVVCCVGGKLVEAMKDFCRNKNFLKAMLHKETSLLLELYKNTLRSHLHLTPLGQSSMFFISCDSVKKRSVKKNAC